MKNMNEARVIKLIKRFCDNFPEKEGIVSFEKHYSGECIYEQEEVSNHNGKYIRYNQKENCIGIYTEVNALNLMVMLADYLHNEGIRNVANELRQACHNNMGLGTIIYFPSLTLEG